MAAQRSRPHPSLDPSPLADESPRGVWLLVGTIAGAKLATLLVVLWMSRSVQTGAIVAATTWHWLVVAGHLVAGPLLLRYRLRRVRARREQLRRAEWMIDETAELPAPGRSDRVRSRRVG